MTESQRIAAAVRRLNITARRIQRHPLSLLPRFARLKLLKGFGQDEIFRLQLLSASEAALSEYVSKVNMVKIQRALNPLALEGQTENKEKFYALCSTLGLPFPRVLTTLDVQAPEESLQKLSALDEGELVVKPTNGDGGSGVMLFRKRDKLFLNQDGIALQENSVLETMGRFRKYRKWIVQQRLHSHEEIFRINASNALQTLRIVTLVDDQQEPSLLVAHLRLAGDGSQIDNFGAGSTGGMICLIDTNAGIIFTGYALSDCGTRMIKNPTHPDTGNALQGLSVPLWDDIRKLAFEAALAMTPTRTIGWDIAVTPEGPMIIEANRYWDPVNLDGGMGQRLRYISSRCADFPRAVRQRLLVGGEQTIKPAALLPAQIERHIMQLGKSSAGQAS
jgi:D-alanine-D-alanine ligase-like ATP-grasp enzyme